MDDLISRQAALDAIGEIHPLDYNAQAIAERIKELPSAQPEIVRCKDCKYWDTTWQNDFAPNCHYCPLIDGMHEGDFYCADAERRTDE